MQVAVDGRLLFAAFLKRSKDQFALFLVSFYLKYFGNEWSGGVDSITLFPTSDLVLENKQILPFAFDKILSSGFAQQRHQLSCN